MEPNFEADLAIDKNRLDEEWLRIAQDLMRYGVLLGQAIYDHNRAKQSLDVTMANLDASIRNEFNTATPPVKFTEAMVDGKIRSAATYIEAQDKLFKASRSMQLHQQAVYAFQAKRAALENLVKLYLNNYWAEPKSPMAQEGLDQAYHKAVSDAIPPETLRKPPEQAPKPMPKRPQPLRRP